MKKAISLIIALALLCGLFTACSPKEDAISNHAQAMETEFRLAELANPFLGKWQSDIPSANTTLIFDYKPDGTFDYEMAGVPAGQEGVGSGGYTVAGNVLVSYLDFEGAALYSFEVVDNSAINVAELEPDESGELVPGNTAPFTRVPGSEVTTENVPFALDNPWIGKWNALIPDDDNPGQFFDLAYEFTKNGVLHTVSNTGAAYPDSCYFVTGDVFVTYMPDYGAPGCFKFSVIDSDSISVTEIDAFNEDGTKVFGDIAVFHREGINACTPATIKNNGVTATYQ